MTSSHHLYPLASQQGADYPYDETRIYRGLLVRVVSDSSAVPAGEWKSAFRHADILLEQA